MCTECSWPEFLEQLEDLIEDERYGFASQTLNGIHDWVEENEHCTQNQKDAVANIENSIEG